MTDKQKIVALAELMGWKVRAADEGIIVADPPTPESFPVLLFGRNACLSRWNPLESIADAWMIVDRMAQLGWWAQLQTPADGSASYWCGFTSVGFTAWNGKPDYWQDAATMPLAICEAAIQAVAL
jgi:hypothetical protein